VEFSRRRSQRRSSALGPLSQWWKRALWFPIPGAGNDALFKLLLSLGIVDLLSHPETNAKPAGSEPQNKTSITPALRER
jgi:hypothetical protein